MDSVLVSPMFSDFSHLMSLFYSGIERAVNGESFPVAMSLKVLQALLKKFTELIAGVRPLYLPCFIKVIP